MSPTSIQAHRCCEAVNRAYKPSAYSACSTQQLVFAHAILADLEEAGLMGQWARAMGGRRVGKLPSAGIWPGGSGLAAKFQRQPDPRARASEGAGVALRRHLGVPCPRISTGRDGLPRHLSCRAQASGMAEAVRAIPDPLAAFLPSN